MLAGGAAALGLGAVVWRGEAGHAAKCRCCVTGGAGVLAALFVAAMGGKRPAFSGVVADLDAERADDLRALLRSDRFLAARFVAV